MIKATKNKLKKYCKASIKFFECPVCFSWFYPKTNPRKTKIKQF